MNLRNLLLGDILLTLIFLEETMPDKACVIRCESYHIKDVAAAVDRAFELLGGIEKFICAEGFNKGQSDEKEQAGRLLRYAS